MLQPNSAGRVRLKLIVRIADFSNLQSQEIITSLGILFGRSHSDLLEKNLGTTLNLTPKVLIKNLGTVQNSTPKHVACPEYVIYWKVSQVILRSIGKYQKDGHLEISGFLKTMFSYLTVGDL